LLLSAAGALTSKLFLLFDGVRHKNSQRGTF
jgi:hypothetical protein